MALNLGELFGRIGLDISPFKKSLAVAEDDIKGFGRNAEVIAIAAGAAIAAGLSAAVVRGIQLEPALDKLTASLGVSEQTAAEYGRIASKVYSDAWGESMEDVTKAIGDVQSAMADLSEADLERITAGVLAMSDALEIDTARAAQVAGQMIKTGLAANAEEGLDLLTAALQRVPSNVRDDVIDAIDEYGPMFKQLGYSGEEAMAMLVKGAEKGMYGIDKTGDAIKEFTIRATDMSKASTDAYTSIGLDANKMSNDLLAGGDRAKSATDQIINGILGIKDPAKQAEAAIALFGTPLEDLGTNEIPAFLEGMKSTSGAMEGFAGANQQMMDTLGSNAQTNITSFLRTLEMFAVETIGGKVIPAISDMAVWLKDNVIPGLEALAGWVDKNSGAIGFFATVIGVLVAGLTLLGIQQAIVASGGLLKFITTAATATKTWAAMQWLFNAAMAANPIGLVIVAIAALVAGLIYAWKNSETFRAVVIGVWEAIKSAVGVVVDWFVGSVLPWLSQVWEGIKAGFGGLVDWASGVFSAAWGFIEKWIVDPIVAAWNGIVAVFTWIQNAFLAVAAWVGSVFAAVWNVIGPIITFPIELGWRIIQAVFILMMRGFMALAGWIASVFGAAWALIEKYMIDPLMKVWAGIVWVFGVVQSAFMAFWQWIATVFMSNFRALERLIGVVMTAVWNVIRIAWDWITDKFTQVWNWVSSTFRGWWNSFTDLMERPIALARDGISRILDAIQGFFRNAVEGIRIIWDALKEAAAAPVRFVINTVINDGIIKGWNDLVGLLKLPDDLKMGPVVVPGLWNGGVLPGPGTSAGDDMLVVDRRGRPRAKVASGEPVISRDAYAANRGVVDAILAGARLPGYFLGGTLPTPGPIRPHGLPYWGASWAGDMGNGTGSPIYAWKDGTVAYTRKRDSSYGWETVINHEGGSSRYAHQSAILVNAGDQVRAGQLIGRVGYSGNVRPRGPGGAHLHFETMGKVMAFLGDAGNNISNGMSAMMSWVTDKLSTPVKALIEKVPGAGVFLDAAKGMGNNLLEHAMTKITSLIPGGDDGSNLGPGVPVTGNVQAVATALMDAGKSLGANAHAMLLALMTVFQESSMQPDFTPDENGDSGLFQNRSGRGDGSIAQLNDPYYVLRLFLFGKQMPGGYKLPSLYDQRGWESKPEWQAISWVQRPAKQYETYYQKHKPTAQRLLAGYKGVGYWLGTNNATPGWHEVAEKEPELVLPSGSMRHFKGGEKVIRGKDLGGETNFYYQPRVEPGRSPKDEFDDAMFSFKHKVDLKVGGRE